LAGYLALTLYAMTHIVFCGAVWDQPCATAFGCYVGTIPLVLSAAIQLQYDIRPQRAIDRLQFESGSVELEIDENLDGFDESTKLTTDHD